MITSITPELEPQDPRYYVFEQGMQKNYFQKRENGDLFVPRVWPGESIFVDYTLPAARDWWGSLHRAYTDNGVAGIWNDMNEPSDFVDQTGKNQIDVVSYDEGEKTTHAKNRNVFALADGARNLRRTRTSSAEPAAVRDHARGLRWNPKIFHHVDRRHEQHLGSAGAEHPDVHHSGSVRRTIRWQRRRRVYRSRQW